MPMQPVSAGFRILAAALAFGVAVPSEALNGATRRGQTPEPTHYKVDMQIEQGGERMVMRRYVDGTRSRTEFDNDGETYVVIEAGDTARTTYTIVPSMKRVMKSTLPQDATATPAPAVSSTAAPGAADDGLELVGTEMIDGRSAEKYRLKMPDSEGFIWIDPSNQLPVRMEAGGSRVDMRNYDFSKPAPELFQVPKGYEVMDLDQMRVASFNAARMVAGGMAGGYAAQAGGNLGGNLGAGIGGAVGGPIGSMIGRFLGQKLGKSLGHKAAGAVVN
jgi:outer membrane lipoprotein-sorting protein